MAKKPKGHKAGCKCPFCAMARRKTRKQSKGSKAKTSKGGGNTASNKKRKIRVGLLTLGVGMWAAGRGANFQADATASGLTLGTRLTRVAGNLIQATIKEGPYVIPIVVGGVIARGFVGDPKIVNSDRVTVSLIGG